VKKASVSFDSPCCFFWKEDGRRLEWQVGLA
jgi:hypothetical protein